MIVALLLVALLLAVRDWSARSPLSSAPADKETIRIQRVIDGDTVLADDGRRIRLLGIDTPELASRENEEERGAREATEWMRAQIEGQFVELQFGPERRDRYGRTLAWIYLPNGELVNRECLAAGHARLVTRFGLPTDLEPSLYKAEMTARVRERGRWAKD